jgi:hypothetical protein
MLKFKKVEDLELEHDGKKFVVKYLEKLYIGGCADGEDGLCIWIGGDQFFDCSEFDEVYLIEEN